MTSDDASGKGRIVVVGTTTITARALHQLAVGIARDAAGVSTRDVSVSLSDERGALRVAVTIPVALGERRPATIVEDGDGVRREIIDRMRDLAGRTVDAVDIRYSGVRRKKERRVR